MATLVALDPRFPIPDSLSTTDPAHPMNLTRAAIELQNQAAADSVYDIPTPERFRKRNVEGFRSPFHGPTDYMLALGLLAFLALIWLYAKETTRPLYSFLLVLVAGILFLIHKKAFDV